MLHSIKEILDIKPYILKLKFEKGEVLNVNLEAKIREWANEPKSIYKQLLDFQYFKTVKYEKEWETIFWDNGIDFCADVLYEIGKETKTESLNNGGIESAIYLLFKNLTTTQKKKTFRKLEKDFQF